jgi:hypothetical protein
MAAAVAAAEYLLIPVQVPVQVVPEAAEQAEQIAT